jgi:hypothetical protein
VARVRVGGVESCVLGGVESCVLEGVKWWWEAGIVLAGVGGSGLWAWGRDCSASCLGLSVGEPCCGGSSILAWGRESGAATTAGTSGESRVVEGTDLGRVLGWHTAWDTWEWVGVEWWHANVGGRSTFLPG